MSLLIRNTTNFENKCDVVSLPCRLNSKEEIKLSRTLDKGGIGGNRQSLLRGFPLEGQEVKLPQEYIGLVTSESNRLGFDTQKRTLRIVGGFDSFMYWNYDRIPSRNDIILSTLDWIDFAEAIHGCATEEDCAE